MRLGITFVLLFLAAVLETAGDAIVRTGIHAVAVKRILLLVAGAAVLFAYGCVVTSPPWDFGRLLGAYIVFVFIVAQLISWIFFHQAPGRSVLIGGAFILTGGLIISIAANSN